MVCVWGGKMPGIFVNYCIIRQFIQKGKSSAESRVVRLARLMDRVQNGRELMVGQHHARDDAAALQNGFFLAFCSSAPLTLSFIDEFLRL